MVSGEPQYGDGSRHLGQWRAVAEREMLADGRAVYEQADGCRILETWRGGKLQATRSLRRDRAAAEAAAARTDGPPPWISDAEQVGSGRGGAVFSPLFLTAFPFPSLQAGCFVCGTVFTLTVRRSHCRACGVLMCSECTRRAPLPWRQGKGPAKCCEDCHIVRQVALAGPPNK